MMTTSHRVRFVLLLVISSLVAAHEYRNVYGEELQTCSRDGTALTGYTRNGRCVAYDGDAGSHHVCINLNSTTGGNFCQVTGQRNWCSSTNMQCHEDSRKRNCAINNWCVCQWAFARYIDRAGGCDQIQDIVCESINMEALTSYRKHKERYATALECLEQRCNLNSKDGKDEEEDSNNKHTEL